MSTPCPGGTWHQWGPAHIDSGGAAVVTCTVEGCGVSRTVRELILQEYVDILLPSYSLDVVTTAVRSRVEAHGLIDSSIDEMVKDIVHKRMFMLEKPGAPR